MKIIINKMYQKRIVNNFRIFSKCQKLLNNLFMDKVLKMKITKMEIKNYSLKLN